MDKWRCPTCGQQTEREKGFTNENIKRLLSWKMSLNDFIFLFIIVMVIVSYFGYKQAVAECEGWQKDIMENPHKFCSNIRTGNFNLTNLTIKIDDGKK